MKSKFYEIIDFTFHPGVAHFFLHNFNLNGSIFILSFILKKLSNAIFSQTRLKQEWTKTWTAFKVERNLMQVHKIRSQFGLKGEPEPAILMSISSYYKE